MKLRADSLDKQNQKPLAMLQEKKRAKINKIRNESEVTTDITEIHFVIQQKLTHHCKAIILQ